MHPPRRSPAATRAATRSEAGGDRHDRSLAPAASVRPGAKAPHPPSRRPCDRCRPAVWFSQRDDPGGTCACYRGPLDLLPPDPYDGRRPSPYGKRCELDGQQLSQADIGRLYETATGTLVEVTDQDLDGMPLPTAKTTAKTTPKTIDIVCFVPAVSIAPIVPSQIGASSCPAAEGVAAKPYELLRPALERSSKVAVAKFSAAGARPRGDGPRVRAVAGCLRA
ncbi:Ku protein [Streptomyces sp. NPDC002886]|uniref:Ku protein n=1 Tax=Streptomyces sp. NPDC002886 TaxID=3364667 RepID=UPI003677E27F